MLPARTPATSIDNLHPCDITIISAMGDSITTADNAKSTSWLTLRQYPGLAWSIGGDSNVQSLPNLFAQSCGRQPQGGSTGETGSIIYNFNFGRSGAVVQNMPVQAQNLVSGIERDIGPARWLSEWKYVSIMIGGNNLCVVCNRPETNNDVVYRDNLREAMETLATMPRTVIALAINLDYTQLSRYVDKFGCKLIMPSVCDCLGTNDPAKMAIAREYIGKYNVAIRELVAEFNAKSDRLSNTKFVAQPFAEATDLAQREWISQADCFHPSAEGQALFARGMWENLQQPVGSKLNKIDPNEQPVCPTADTKVGV
jgi:lysophospholipase L1-like esterase